MPGAAWLHPCPPPISATQERLGAELKARLEQLTPNPNPNPNPNPGAAGRGAQGAARALTLTLTLTLTQERLARGAQGAARAARRRDDVREQQGARGWGRQGGRAAGLAAAPLRRALERKDAALREARRDRERANRRHLTKIPTLIAWSPPTSERARTLTAELIVTLTAIVSLALTLTLTLTLVTLAAANEQLPLMVTLSHTTSGDGTGLVSASDRGQAGANHDPNRRLARRRQLSSEHLPLTDHGSTPRPAREPCSCIALEAHSPASHPSLTASQAPHNDDPLRDDTFPLLQAVKLTASARGTRQAAA